MEAETPSGPQVTTIPHLSEADFSDSVAGWKTTLFNCSCHSFSDVIAQLVVATGCSSATASQLANTVHHTGSAVVYRGARPECERVSTILSQIGLRTDVSW